MPTNYPTSLDTDTELYQVVDNLHDVMAAHHNNLKDAIKAIEAVLGITGAFNFTTDSEFSGHTGAGNPHSTSASDTDLSNHAAATATHGVAQVANHAEIASQILTHKNISTAHHTPPTAGDFNHNSLANINAGDTYEHISATQLAALHPKDHNNTEHTTNYATASDLTDHTSAGNPHSTSASDTDLSNHASATATHGVAQVANHAEIGTQIGTHTSDDNAHHEVFESLAGDATPQLVVDGELDLNKGAICLNVTTADDHDGVGISVIFVAASSGVTLGDAVYITSGGEIARADATNNTTMPAIGIAMETKTSAICRVLMYGWFRDESWSWTDGGEDGIVYISEVGTAGNTMTQSTAGFTTTGEQVQVIGYGTGAYLLVMPSLVLVEVA